MTTQSFSPRPPHAGSSATRLFWIIGTLGWAAVLTITAGLLYAAGFRPFKLILAMALALWSPYVVLTPLVFLFASRLPISSTNQYARIFIHILASVAFVVVCESISLSFMRVLLPAGTKSFVELQSLDDSDLDTASVQQIPTPIVDSGGQTMFPPPSVRMAGIRALANFPLYWLIFGFVQVQFATARLREREQQAAELAARLAQARLDGLRTQLQPHFLFNTLNSISALIPHDARLANEMVLNLSDLLRMTLGDSQRNEIPLSEEIKLLGHYVDIQKLRFGERLTFKLDVDEPSMNCPVPPLLLQPLVENAIRYGVERSEHPETVSVNVKLDDQTLVLEVFNTCHTADEDTAPAASSPGVGLTNTGARLFAMYGVTQQFQYGPVPDGFRVAIRVPSRMPDPLRHED